MLKLKPLALISLLALLSCNQETHVVTEAEKRTDSPTLAENTNVKEGLLLDPLKTESNSESVNLPKLSKVEAEIQELIRQVLNWSNSENAIDVLPAQMDSKGRAYTGFNLVKHRENLQRLRETRLFAQEFIENYDKIILTLHQKLTYKEFDEWLVGDLPTFYFANDADPWCLCQDVPYDKPNPWDFIEAEPLKMHQYEGDLNWKWGKTELNNALGWKEFRYRFRVRKENGKWKISYLEGFDFEKSIK